MVGVSTRCRNECTLTLFGTSKWNLKAKYFKIGFGDGGEGSKFMSDLVTVDKDVVTQKALHQSCVSHYQCIK